MYCIYYLYFVVYLYVLSGILKECFYKKKENNKKTDFAHLNDSVSRWQTLNCKLCSIHDTQEGLADRLFIKLQSAAFYSFHKLGHKNTIS